MRTIGRAAWFFVLASSSGCEDLKDLLDYNGIAQSVPPNGSKNVPLLSPIVIFADDTYNSVNFEASVVDATGSEVDVTESIRVEKKTSGADKDIYVVTTADGWPPSSDVTLVVTGDIDRKVGFSTMSDPGLLSTPTDLDFETGTVPDLPAGWRGFGDYGAIGAKGSLEASSGRRYLAMSSGNAVAKKAISDTSTMVVSDPIDGAGALSFDYAFQSSEFDDFCGSDFDDTFLLVVSGPDGALARVVDSVNLVCDDRRQKAASFPSMPDDGDNVYKGTRSAKESVNLDDIGSPFSVSFVVTDVGDDAYTTVVAVDDVRHD